MPECRILGSLGFILGFGSGLLVGYRKCSQDCNLGASIWMDIGSVLADSCFLLPILLKINFNFLSVLSCE